MNDIQVITSKIKTLPGRPAFMIDRDLAMVYGTSTERINQAVKRNPDRFPDDFVFQLAKDEAKSCLFEITDCDLKKDRRGGRRYLPYGFTREGCNMLSAVLNTPIAIQRSIQIMRAFTAMERGESAAISAIRELAIEMRSIKNDVASLKSRPPIHINLPDDNALPIALERKLRKRGHSKLFDHPEAETLAIKMLLAHATYAEVVDALKKQLGFEISDSAIHRYWAAYRRGYLKWN